MIYSLYSAHTFASHCAMAGVDLRTLAELLGHKTLDMVMGYSHLSLEHKAAVALLDNLEDRSRVEYLCGKNLKLVGSK